MVQEFPKRQLNPCRGQEPGEWGCRVSRPGRSARWRHYGRATRPQRVGVRCGWRNLPRSYSEGGLQRKFVDAAREFRQPRVYMAYKNLRCSVGYSLDEKGGNGVLWSSWVEIPVRLSNKVVLSKGVERHGGQSGSALSRTTFERDPACQCRSRTDSRTAVSRGNTWPCDGCSGFLGVAFIR